MIWILATLLSILFQQTPSVPAGNSIDGVVIDNETNRPLPKTVVVISETGGMAPQSRSVETGLDGRFELRNLPPGIYQVGASRTDYVRAEYRSLNLAANQRTSGLQIPLTRAGVIAGRLRGKQGEPVALAQVQALRVVYENGSRTLATEQMAQSNDLGEYRLSALSPGRYLVMAMAPAPDATPIVYSMRAYLNQTAASSLQIPAVASAARTANEVNAPVYFPGALAADMASPVDVRAGATIGGIDFVVTPTPARHIRGSVLNRPFNSPDPLGRGGARGGGGRGALPPPAIPSSPVEATLFVGPRNSASGLIAARYSVSRDGSFDVAGVIPGSYVLVAAAGNMLGMANVDVAGVDVQVSISLEPTVDIPVHISTDGTPVGGPLSLDKLRFIVTMNPAIPEMPTRAVTPDAAGTFVLPVSPGNYRLSISAGLAGGYVKSMRLGNADVLMDGLHVEGKPDSVLEIVLGTRPGNIEGNVNFENRAPAWNATVALMPDPSRESQTGLYRTVQPDPAGRFRFADLPPGSYRILAASDIPRGAWQDPGFATANQARAIEVQVSEGRSSTVNLVVVPPQ